MRRYIDAERLNKEVLASWDKDTHKTLEASRVHRQEHHHLMRIIEKQPTADVVEVVRCKDCKESEICPDTLLWCNQWERLVPPKGFCHCGERREE